MSEPPQTFIFDMKSYLRSQGVPEDQIAEAEKKDELRKLAVEWRFVGERPRYTEAEMLEKVGVSREFAQKFWRAFGFPIADSGDRVFTDEDAEALQTVKD